MGESCYPSGTDEVDKFKAHGKDVLVKSVYVQLLLTTCAGEMSCLETPMAREICCPKGGCR